MTRIFIADVSCIDIEAFLGKVSPARREKTLRLSKDDDKRRSLGAEMLLIKAAGRDDYVLSKNEKPYFPDNEVFFSLAHCGDYAVCAVSDVPVGVDIELPRAGGSSLAKRFSGTTRLRSFTLRMTRIASSAACGRSRRATLNAPIFGLATCGASLS